MPTLNDFTGAHDVTAPAEAPGGRAFEYVTILHFVAAGADSLSVEGTDTVLKGTFQHYDYDALAVPVNDPLRARVSRASDPSDALIVEMDTPRQVLGVGLTPGKAGGTVELYRLDGAVLASKATIVAGYGDPLGDFTDARFAVRLKAPGYVTLAAGDLTNLSLRSYPATPRLSIAGAPDPSKPDEVTTMLFWPAAAGSGAASPATVQDARAMPLEAPDPAGAEEQIARPERHGIFDAAAGPADLTGFENLSGLAAKRDFEWEVIAGRTVAVKAGAPPVALDAGDALAEALNRYLQSLARPAPAEVDVKLVAASDAPCVLDIQSAAITYRRVRESFATGEPKQVLRFANDRLSSQQVIVQLPAGVQVVSATLRTLEELRSDRLAADGGLIEDLAGLPDLLAGPDGVYLAGERWAGQRLQPAAAISASGIGLGLLPVADGTEVAIELQEDWRGLPSGKALASATLRPGPAGLRQWFVGQLAATVILSAQTYWLLAKATQGSAVWLSTAEDKAASVLMLERASPTTPWVKRSAVNGQTARYRLLSPAAPAGASGQATALSVGDKVVAAAHPEGHGIFDISANAQENALVYDLADALNTYLQEQAQAGPTEIPLTFVPGAPGFITVYPPRIEW
jgi:hypothetical protein